MPRVWNETVEAHRRGVREAILDAAWTLVNERGPASVTMSEIAERAGIGRATLYKYFADVEMVLAAWHHRHITDYLDHLIATRDRAGDGVDRLCAVFVAYCRHHRERARHERHQPHGAELAILLHRADAQVHAAQQQLHALIRDLVADAANAGLVREDVGAGELATYCLHALSAADALDGDAAIDRLVRVVVDGLHPRS
ncbi:MULTISPECIES: TetR/AcrR family transcriptional regulator [Nocardia]|uniref:TetR/AcrR family transcriptional regulator n=1 Tax=Nocardia TaxID=1817 RepID=UPI000593256E|nr:MULTISPECIES: TetR/AcrR family transcriptional regulator [Nocardia]